MKAIRIFYVVILLSFFLKVASSSGYFQSNSLFSPAITKGNLAIHSDQKVFIEMEENKAENNIQLLFYQYSLPFDNQLLNNAKESFCESGLALIRRHLYIFLGQLII